MTKKVGGSESVPASKSKTIKTTTRRTSGAVVSVNKSRADDIFINDDAEDVTVAELSRDTIDLDDIYDFGSSPPRPPATILVKNAKCRKTMDTLTSRQKKSAHSSEYTEDVSQRCYKELLQLREEVSSTQSHASLLTSYGDRSPETWVSMILKPSSKKAYCKS